MHPQTVLDVKDKSLDSSIVLYQDLHVRPFVVRDAPHVIALISAVLIEHGFSIALEDSDVDVANIPSYYTTGEFWVVCSSAGAVVATGAFRALHNASAPASVYSDDRPCELRRLYVDRLFRRRGLGGMLLRALENRASLAGFTYMLLESATELHAAMELYRSEGYAPAKLPGDVCGTKRCNLVMSKELHRTSKLCKGEVIVVDENGKQFAQLPLPVARRGGMRMLAVAISRLHGDRLEVHRDSLRGAKVAVVYGGESVEDAASRVNGEVVASVDKIVAFERETKGGLEKLFCHVFSDKRTETVHDCHVQP